MQSHGHLTKSHDLSFPMLTERFLTSYNKLFPGSKPIHRMSDRSFNYEPFDYAPLDESTNEIRLLSLHPSAFPDWGVEISILHAKLSDPPKYEALSYMWGTEDNSMPIYLPSGSGKLCLVRRNLGLALKRLRLRNEERVLWVDAICIDQRNTAERNHQVGQMSKVRTSTW